METEKKPAQTPILTSIIALGIMLLLLAWPFQAIWNGNVPSVINGVGELTYGQSLGFLFLFYLAGRVMNVGD